MPEMSPTLNRFLLLELCAACKFKIGNTIFDNLPKETVTYYAVGASPQSQITPNTFAQLDVFLIPEATPQEVQSIKSHMHFAIPFRRF